MSQNFIDSPLAIRKTREADLYLSHGVTFSLSFCALLMLLFISTSPEWAMDIPGTQAVRNPTDAPHSLSPPFIKEKQHCANYTDPYSWPLTARPSSPPFCSLFSTLSFRAVLFVLVSCSWERTRLPSDHPHTRRHPLSRHGNPLRHLRPSPDRAQCKWGLEREGEDVGSCPNFVNTSPRITLLEEFWREKLKADVS